MLLSPARNFPVTFRVKWRPDGVFKRTMAWIRHHLDPQVHCNLCHCLQNLDMCRKWVRQDYQMGTGQLPPQRWSLNLIEWLAAPNLLRVMIQSLNQVWWELNALNQLDVRCC